MVKIKNQHRGGGKTTFHQMAEAYAKKEKFNLQGIIFKYSHCLQLADYKISDLESEIQQLKYKLELLEEDEK